MPDRKMFWRIIRRLFAAQRGRLLVILLALGAGAALTAALLNIQIDVKSRLTKEFRAFGANVVVVPSATNDFTHGATLDEAVVQRIREFPPPSPNSFVFSSLNLIADVSSSHQTVKAVVIGKRLDFPPVPITLRPKIPKPPAFSETCSVGSRVAEQLQLKPSGEGLIVKYSGREEVCDPLPMGEHGDETDSQVWLRFDAAERLAALPGKISLIEISVAGTPREIQNYIAALTEKIPSADVHGLRQFTNAEGKIYNRISGLLTATIALVLSLTALCVMAAMTNVAMERRNDVGLMKAIGGATRRVLRLFFAEAALLGLTGGVIGSAAGILFSVWLGKTVFGVAAHPRLIVYPVSVTLTILVAVVSAYPLRRLANISPSSVFRGEA